MMIKKPLIAGLGCLAVLLGAVWAGQGVGLLGGSSMTGDRTWLAIGVGLLAVGISLVVASTRGTSRRDLNGPPGQH